MEKVKELRLAVMAFLQEAYTQAHAIKVLMPSVYKEAIEKLEPEIKEQQWRLELLESAPNVVFLDEGKALVKSRLSNASRTK